MSILIPTNRGHELEWRSESTQKPPAQAVYSSETNAAAVLAAARNNTATVWTGDYHNAKQVLAAMKKCLPRAKRKLDADIQTAFHTHRMRQSQNSRLLNMLAVEIGADFSLNLPRSPDAAAALADVYGAPSGGKPFLLPLNRLLGYIGAHEWHKKGVSVPALNGRIHVPFGVFSPLRGEYLDLIAQAPLPPECRTAFDVGTGSGVIAALLARCGIPHITATDTNPRAIACARANIERLGFSAQVAVETADLFPQGTADLIVCNPPWLPAKPTSAMETALYDPGHAMLKGFLNGVKGRLNSGGEAWLIMSDLAEHLHLRAPDFLETCFQTASLRVAGILSTRPVHNKAANSSDPLAFARRRETTFLYRLKAG